MQEVQEDTSAKHDAGDDDIVYILAKRFTGAYLFLALLATIVNFTGYERWLFGLAPEISANAVGDTLAGTFAPLAFLWFFVSTWLQRKELRETRDELAKQATESANQTTIMRSREVYEEHRLRMYYLAAFVWREVLSNKIKIKRNQEIVKIDLLDVPYPDFTFKEDNLVVDALFHELKSKMSKAVEILSSPDVYLSKKEQDMSPATRHLYGISSGASLYNEVSFMSSIAHYLASELRSLTNDKQYRDNPLIAARIRGTDLGGTSDAAEALANRFVNLLADADHR